MSYNTYPNDSKFYLLAHGSIYADNKMVNLKNIRVVTTSIYGNATTAGVCDNFLIKNSEELGEIIYNPTIRKKFEDEALNEFRQEYPLQIHAYQMQDWDFDFIVDHEIENENGNTVFRISPSGLVNYDNKDALSYLKARTLNEENSIIYREIKESKFNNVDDFTKHFNDNIHIWIPNQSQALINYFYDIAIEKIRKKEEFIFKDIFRCTLSELIDNNLIQNNSLLLGLSCREVYTYFPEDFNLSEDILMKGAGTMDEQFKRRKQEEERHKADPHRFLDVSLQDVCKSTSCKGSGNALAGRGSDSDMFCKEQGCLDCQGTYIYPLSDNGYYNTCRSCEEGKAVLVNCKGANIILCFTTKEIVGFFRNNFGGEDLATSFSYCSIPKLTVAGLLSTDDNEPNRKLGVDHIQSTFINVLQSLDEDKLVIAYRNYINDIVWSLMFTGDILKTSFNNSVNPVIIDFSATYNLPEIPVVIRSIIFKLDRLSQVLNHNYTLDNLRNFLKTAFISDSIPTPFNG
jgi:hypothetical protein